MFILSRNSSEPPDWDAHPDTPRIVVLTPLVVHVDDQSKTPVWVDELHVVDEFNATHFVTPYDGKLTSNAHPQNKTVFIIRLIFPPCNVYCMPPIYHPRTPGYPNHHPQLHNQLFYRRHKHHERMHKNQQCFCSDNNCT